MSSAAGRSLKSRANPWLVVVLLILVSALLYQVLGVLFVDASGVRTVTPRGSLAEFEQATIEVYRAASRSVVHIETLNWQGQNLFSASMPRGVGSGIVWDKAGHIVTNLHVLDNANLANVTLPDESVWQARTVGVSSELDIAVLKIDAGPSLLTPIAIGTSNDLQIGQHVLAIGNPFGLDQTLTTGVISGLGRQIPLRRDHVGKVEVLSDVIQTDTAINPGNSGGPLLDSAGRLVGVNTMIYSESGVNVGVGFAVPVDRVARDLPRILAKGTGDRPGLGVTMFTDRVVRELVAGGVLPQMGVLVRRVIPQGAADEAGIQSTTPGANQTVNLGDLIIRVDGRKIEGQGQLFDVLEEHSVGDSVRVHTLRNGKQFDYTVVLRPLPIIQQ
jgi:S1-C subfamily serine protease